MSVTRSNSMAAAAPDRDLAVTYTSACAEFGCTPHAPLAATLSGMSPADTAHLDLSEMPLGGKSLLPVLKFLRHCTGLEVLSLRGAGITNPLFTQLCELHPALQQLVVLDLSCNPELSRSAPLVEAVKSLPLLARVKLKGTGFDPSTRNIIAASCERRRKRSFRRAISAVLQRHTAEQQQLLATSAGPREKGGNPKANHRCAASLSATAQSPAFEPEDFISDEEGGCTSLPYKKEALDLHLMHLISSGSVMSPESVQQMFRLSKTYSSSTGEFAGEDPLPGVLRHCERMQLTFCLYLSGDRPTQGGAGGPAECPPPQHSVATVGSGCGGGVFYRRADLVVFDAEDDARFADNTLQRERHTRRSLHAIESGEGVAAVGPLPLPQAPGAAPVLRVYPDLLQKPSMAFACGGGGMGSGTGGTTTASTAGVSPRRGGGYRAAAALGGGEAATCGASDISSEGGAMGAPPGIMTGFATGCDDTPCFDGAALRTVLVAGHGGASPDFTLQHFFQVIEALPTQLLEGCIRPAGSSPHGAYTVRLQPAGRQPSFALVDDFLPCDTASQLPLWGLTELLRTKALWLQILARHAALHAVATRCPAHALPAALHSRLSGGVSVEVALRPPTAGGTACAAQQQHDPVWHLLHEVSLQMGSCVAFARPRGGSGAGGAGAQQQQHQKRGGCLHLAGDHLYFAHRGGVVQRVRVAVLSNSFASALGASWPEPRGDEAPAYARIVEQSGAPPGHGAFAIPYTTFCREFASVAFSLTPPPHAAWAEASWGSGCPTEGPMYRIVLRHHAVISLLLDTPHGAPVAPLSIVLYHETRAPPCRECGAVYAESPVSDTTLLPFVTSLCEGLYYIEVRRHSSAVSLGPGAPQTSLEEEEEEQEGGTSSNRGTFRLCVSSQRAEDQPELERVPGHRDWHRGSLRLPLCGVEDVDFCGGAEVQASLGVGSRGVARAAPLRCVLRVVARCDGGRGEVQAAHSLRCVLCVGGGRRVLGYIPESSVLARFSSSSSSSTPGAATALLDMLLPSGTYTLVAFAQPPGVTLHCTLDAWCAGETRLCPFPALLRASLPCRWDRGRGGSVTKGNPAVRVTLPAAGGAPVLLRVSGGMSAVVSFDVIPYQDLCGRGGAAEQLQQRCTTDGVVYTVGPQEGAGDGRCAVPPGGSGGAAGRLPAAIASSPVCPIATELLYTPLGHRPEEFDVVLVVHHHPAGVSGACTVSAVQEGCSAGEAGGGGVGREAPVLRALAL